MTTACKNLQFWFLKKKSLKLQLRKGVKRKADTTTPSGYSNELVPSDYGESVYEPEKLNSHSSHGPPTRRESVRQIKKPKRDLLDEQGAVSTMVNSHLLPHSEVN